MSVGTGERRRSGKRGASPAAAPSSTSPPMPAGSRVKGSPRRALLAALAEREREVAEAREQQAAIVEVLEVINASSGDLTAAFDAIVEKAVRFSEATGGGLWVVEGETARAVGGSRGTLPQPFIDYVFRAPLPISEVLGRNPHGRPFVHIEDLKATRAYRDRAPFVVASVELGEMRTTLLAPLRENGAVVGIISLIRNHVRPFTDRQIALVQAFAAQALIAIKNARLFNDTKEALERQTATAEVLEVINASPGDLEPVFDVIVEKAVRFCDAAQGLFWLVDGETARLPDHHGGGWVENLPRSVPLMDLLGREAHRQSFLHIDDLKATKAYRNRVPIIATSVDLGGVRTNVTVPMLEAGTVVGVFTLARSEVRPFTDNQIALVRAFATQALIAIKNARLFNETKEALERQKASGEVLSAISRSVSDASPVFDRILDGCERLVAFDSAAIFLVDGERQVRPAAGRSVRGQAIVEALKALFPQPIERTPMHRAFQVGGVVIFGDVANDPDAPWSLRAAADKMGSFSVVVAPMLWEGRGIGAIHLSRDTNATFTDNETALLKTFADQAVIAIQNARLFNETKEALERQTAMAEVLEVINASPGNLAPVFDAIVEKAVRLCDASRGGMWLIEGDRVRAVGGGKLPAPYLEYVSREPILLSQVFGQAAQDRPFIHIADLAATKAYRERNPLTVATVELGGVRTFLAAPLRDDSAVVGFVNLFRDDVRPFADNQIALVRAFAAQALIAIENVRLFEEVQARTRDLTEALQQQTATADVLKVISRSAFDLQAVLDTLIETAVDLNNAHTGTICVRQGDAFAYRAFGGKGRSETLEAHLRANPAIPGRDSIAGRAILNGRIEHVRDILEDADYHVPIQALGNPSRSLIGVPLIGKDRVEGAIVLTRLEPGPYPARQIEILQTFADQAVIAIENSRLFNQVQARTRELVASLDDLRKAQDRLIQSEKLASLGQLTAGIAHEIKNPLNFINNFSSLSGELMDELRAVLERVRLEGHDREEAEDLMGMIDANLDKVVSHGKRADSIVKNMLLHSREGSGERTNVNINAMVEEALNLAYHGARAEKRGFNVTIEKALDSQAGSADLYLQEMTRVLLNLISNGFYATTKRKQADGDPTYEPTIFAATRDLGERVEIAIRDNGTGVPDEVKAKMFNPFFTTKPAGEGTGLGLSLSHDIVVKQHGGTIEVSTERGAYTQFTITLPRSGGGA